MSTCPWNVVLIERLDISSRPTWGSHQCCRYCQHRRSSLRRTSSALITSLILSPPPVFSDGRPFASRRAFSDDGLRFKYSRIGSQCNPRARARSGGSAVGVAGARAKWIGSHCSERTGKLAGWRTGTRPTGRRTGRLVGVTAVGRGGRTERRTARRGLDPAQPAAPAAGRRTPPVDGRRRSTVAASRRTPPVDGRRRSTDEICNQTDDRTGRRDPPTVPKTRGEWKKSVTDMKGKGR